MRQARVVLVTLLLMATALTASATESGQYRDDFGDGNYSGNDGSLEFSGPWAEFGDTGGPGGGNVHVGPEYCSNNDCLHIEGGEGLLDLGLVATSYGVQRAADLSMFTSAELCFDIQIIPQEGITTAELWVQVYDGSRWVTIKEYALAQSINHHKTLDVTSYLSEAFQVRFKVPNAVESGLLGLDLFYNGYATIDRVEIYGETQAATTTTTASTTSTTSTTIASTVTTKPGAATTTTTSTTDTSRPDDPAATTTTTVRAGSGEETTTTTTAGEDTSTTVIAIVGGPPTPPSNSGLRDPGTGLLADYSEGMMGDMAEVEVLGAELTADYSLAVEAFEGAKVWIAVLTLLIGAAIVSGMDTRRAEKTGRV
ncbi:MAG TPA: hypothetical protein VI141_06885 [Acidimicrobiia bacterium]